MVLTTNDEDFDLYWTDYFKEISRMLWLYTLTDGQYLDSNFQNGCFQSSRQNWKQLIEQAPMQKNISRQTLWKFLPSL